MQESIVSDGEEDDFQNFKSKGLMLLRFKAVFGIIRFKFEHF